MSHAHAVQSAESAAPGFTLDPRVAAPLAALGADPLSEQLLASHVFPLFSRVRARSGLYFANHSLGRPLDLTEQHVREALDPWYADLDGAWGPWFAEILNFRAGIARLIGCARPDAVVPKTSAGQGLRAVLNALPSARPRVLTSAGEFDSTDFILKTYEQRGRAEVMRVPALPGAIAARSPRIEPERILAALRHADRPYDLLVLSHVFFTTGQILEHLPEIIALAHQAGTLVLLDCYHSAGVVPIGFDALGCDFAVGGSYKYTRGGPGACWLAVGAKHLASDSPLRTLDTGWFAKEEPFAFQRSDKAQTAAGGDAWLENTPTILPLYQARAGLHFTLAMGVERLRAYSLQQLERLEARLHSLGVSTASPHPDREHCGGFLLVPSADPPALLSRMAAEGLNADARGGFVRLGPDVLTTGEELEQAAHIVAACVLHSQFAP